MQQEEAVITTYTMHVVYRCLLTLCSTPHLQIARSKFASLLTDLTTSSDRMNASRHLDLLILIKHIDALNVDYATRIRPHIERALRDMCDMCVLGQQVEELRQPYDRTNADHEQQLMRVRRTCDVDVRAMSGVMMSLSSSVTLCCACLL